MRDTKRPLLDRAVTHPADLPKTGCFGVADATHLVTGDRRHFGALFGKHVAGVLVVRPADHMTGRGR